MGTLAVDPDTGDDILLGRLDGHAMVDGAEGWLAVDCYAGRCATNVRATTRQGNGPTDSVSGAGHGLCSCGTLSEHLPTGVARRGWHRRHKARVCAGLPEPDGQPAPVVPGAW